MAVFISIARSRTRQLLSVSFDAGILSANLLIEIVPEVVIGPPDKPAPVAIEVTVPLGSSPDGITTQAEPLEMIISPALHAGHLVSAV